MFGFSFYTTISLLKDYFIACKPIVLVFGTHFNFYHILKKFSIDAAIEACHHTDRLFCTVCAEC